MSDLCGTVPLMQSEQTRQRKRQQRERKREEKRQRLRSGMPLDAFPVPQTPISEVLLEYVSPLVHKLLLAGRVEQLFRYGNDPRQIASVDIVSEGDRIRVVAVEVP